MSLISVIIPVYNTEQYIARAIYSIVQQSYKEWELLLIDDCSTDKSLSVCLDWERKDTRIRVIPLCHNGGVAFARNVGISKAKGDYLSFVDSDDCVKSNFLEVMYRKAEQFNADVVWCNYREVIENSHEKKIIVRKHDLPSDKVLDNKFLINIFFTHVVGVGSMCNKLYRRNLLDVYGFKLNVDRVRAEDWEFNLFVFSKVNKLIPVEDVLYDYIRRSDSIMNTYREKDFVLMCSSQEILLNIAKQYKIQIDYIFFWGNFILNVVEHMLLMVRSESVNLEKEVKFILSHPMFLEATRWNIYSLLPRYYKLVFFFLKRRSVRWVLFLLCIRK